MDSSPSTTSLESKHLNYIAIRARRSEAQDRLVPGDMHPAASMRVRAGNPVRLEIFRQHGERSEPPSGHSHRARSGRDSAAWPSCRGGRRTDIPPVRPLVLTAVGTWVGVAKISLLNTTIRPGRVLHPERLHAQQSHDLLIRLAELLSAGLLLQRGLLRLRADIGPGCASRSSRNRSDSKPAHGSAPLSLGAGRGSPGPEASPRPPLSLSRT